MVWYVNEQRKQKEEARKKSSTKSVGTPDLGGPFHLTDHDGKECTDKDYIGKWLIIYFGFTFCPDICPDELDKLTVALNRLGKAVTKTILCTIYISFASLYNTVVCNTVCGKTFEGETFTIFLIFCSTTNVLH